MVKWFGNIAGDGGLIVRIYWWWWWWCNAVGILVMESTEGILWWWCNGVVILVVVYWCGHIGCGCVMVWEYSCRWCIMVCRILEVVAVVQWCNGLLVLVDNFVALLVPLV